MEGFDISFEEQKYSVIPGNNLNTPFLLLADDVPYMWIQLNNKGYWQQVDPGDFKPVQMQPVQWINELGKKIQNHYSCVPGHNILEDEGFDRPFSINLGLENRQIEVVVIPEWCDQELESLFTIYFDGKKIGLIRRKHCDVEGWEWKEGALEEEKASLIGDQIDIYYL